MSFYVFLPSNACSTQFPNNTQSNYSTILKKPLILDSDYEVAVTEFVYSPNYLANFGQLQFNDEIIQLRIRNGIEKTFLIQSLNKIIREHILKKESVANFEQQIKDETIPMFTDNFSLKFKGSIKFIGNFSMILSNKHETILNGGDFFEINQKNLNVANYAAIYTNIIDEQLFGDALVPLLRCINLTSSSVNSLTTTSFDNLVYVPINKRVITTINIKITDLEGQLIQFDDVFSFVVLTLHFRKKYYA